MREVSIGCRSPLLISWSTGPAQVLTTSAWKPAFSFATAPSSLAMSAYCTLSCGFCFVKLLNTAGANASSYAKIRRLPLSWPDAPVEPLGLEEPPLGAGELPDDEHAA